MISKLVKTSQLNLLKKEAQPNSQDFKMSNLPYPTQPGYPNNAAPPYPPDPNAQPPYGQPPPYAPTAPPAPGQYPPAPYPPGQNQQPYPQGGQNFIKIFFKPRMQCCHGVILTRFFDIVKILSVAVYTLDRQ